MKRIFIVLMVVAIMVTSFGPISVQATTTDNEFEENPYFFEYEGNQYIVPPLYLNREPGVTETGYVERYTEVPHFFQSYYPNVRYGNTSIRQGGCGIACVSMVLTYLLDKEVGIEELAEKYFRYKGKYGSSYNLFYDSAEDYGVTVTTTPVYDWDTVREALEDGHVVIANPTAPSLFTEGGHYIVLAGLTEDGKIVVRDPNLYNYSIWNYPARADGYANGFDEKYIKYSCLPCWIYEKKDLEEAAARIKNP